MDDVGDVTANALEYLRKETIDVYNRLHSIAEDARFVDDVHSVYPAIPILPNLRCGAWYTDPLIATPTPAYFKSTDGHFSNWSFNLRRANLHLLPLIIEQHGIILVDSTRTGKRIPDALSKTIPIWCAVINRAVARRFPESTPSAWDGNLYTPPAVVSAQEHDQIEKRIEGWAEALFNSSFDLPRLPAPLRPLWLTPATTTFPSLPSPDDPTPFLPIICLSASKQIHTGTERRAEGFAYVQGSGDDHELWSMGLTPTLFWTHKHALLDASHAELPALINQLVSCSNHNHPQSMNKAQQKPTPIEKVGGRVLVCALGDLEDLEKDGDTAYILIEESSDAKHDSSPSLSSQPTSKSRTLRLRLPPGKRGQTHLLTHVFPAAVDFAWGSLSGRGPGGKFEGEKVCVACTEGRDVGVGVALVLIWLFFDEQGQPRAGYEGVGVGVDGPLPVDKKALHTRLEWIIASRAEANPSRGTLKRVNEYFMTPRVYARS